MIETVADLTFEELERMEREHPEMGRLEVIDGALHATGESALGIFHQLAVQRLHLLMAAACPPGFLVMLDTWWFAHRGKLRADVGIYTPADIPIRGKVFRTPPQAIVEILSDDAHHDLVHKDEIYAEAGARRAYLDPDRRRGWWLQLDGTTSDAAAVTWQLDGWPPITLERDALLRRGA